MLFVVFEKTIQRRISDSVDFDRGWDDYVNGFGEEDGNYWMGLEEIHQLSTAHDVSLFIDIETFEGEPFTVTLQTFSVGNATGNYTLNYSGYSQSSDRLKRPLFYNSSSVLMFTTRDQDNDRARNYNCASDIYRGGWWYDSCLHFTPNGYYEGDVRVTPTAIIVMYIDTTVGRLAECTPVKSLEMIIRARAN